ncbi:unnamed protein product [Ophioblennius macclurei]
MDSSKVIHRRKPDFPGTGVRASQRSQYHENASKNLELGKVLRLLEDPLTANLKERHILVLKKLLKRNQTGFVLKELTGVGRILSICAEKATEHPEYLLILCEALKLCRLPFLKEKASDELLYAQDVVDFLGHLGCLMRVSDVDVRQNVLESVKSFYSCVGTKPPPPPPDGTERPSEPRPPTFPSDDRFSRLSLSETR